MTAWLCVLETLYSLDVNQKGYLSFHVLTHLDMNHQPFATALPIKLVVIANGVRQSSFVSVSFSQG